MREYVPRLEKLESHECGIDLSESVCLSYVFRHLGIVKLYRWLLILAPPAFVTERDRVYLSPEYTTATTARMYASSIPSEAAVPMRVLICKLV